MYQSCLQRLMALLVVAGLLMSSASLVAAKTHKAKARSAVATRQTVKSQSRAKAKSTAVRRRRVAQEDVFSTRGRRVRIVRASLSSRSSRGRNRGRAIMPGSAVLGGPWTSPTFADSTEGDNIDGEDLIVRKAAVEALGPYNGTVIVADPQTGRILTIVNQKLALKSGFQPCSTVKIVSALAGLSEGVIDKNGTLGGRMTLTDALAHSNNAYFANIGVKLGYDKVASYARQFGLGEKAGLNIAGEESGGLPDGPPANGGMAMMTSFGEGITLTPLELTALVSSVANGGTLYYLQYPRSASEVHNLVPRVKRHLAIQQFIPEIKPGMMGAVEYGTARRANFDPNEPILGKTGTCTDRRTPTHLGWFSSFNDIGKNKLVVTVLLTGGRPINGPVASGIAGGVYKQLSAQNYFGNSRLTSPMALMSTQSCCTR